MDAIRVADNAFAENKRRLVSKGELFVDDEFPAQDSSIFFSRRPPRPFQWKRPHVSGCLTFYV